MSNDVSLTLILDTVGEPFFWIPQHLRCLARFFSVVARLAAAAASRATTETE